MRSHASSKIVQGQGGGAQAGRLPPDAAGPESQGQDSDTTPLSLVIEGKDGPRETVKASAVARHALTLWERYGWNAQWKTGAGVYVQGARFAGVVSV
jgi:hypothetical protein